MKWIGALGITVVVAFLILYEWPRMKPDQKKEKKVFIILLAFDWLFSLVLLFYPDLPNPMIPLAESLGKMLKLEQ